MFSEKEASEVLQRAARLQEQGGGGDYTPGVTYDELVRIAAEAGINPEFLKRALEAPAGSGPKQSLFNLVEEQERVLDGELDTDGLGDLLDQVRDIVRLNRIQSYGRSFEAQANRGAIFGTLRISSKRGRTRISLRQVPFIAYFAGLHAPLIASIPTAIGLGVSGNILAAILVPLALLAVGGSVFYAVAQAGKRRAREAFTKIVAIAERELSRDPGHYPAHDNSPLP